MLPVSVAMCCYNSASRLPRVLQHLAEQQIPGELEWEIVVVDNLSTDSTKEVAQTLWRKMSSVPMRIVEENKQGAGFARYRGLCEAQYEVICFVDDDVWLSPDYLRLASEIMSQHPQVGVLGSLNEGVCEIAPPHWYERFHWSYALGPQGEQASDVTDSRGFVFGAGLVVRKSAWQEIINKTQMKSLLCSGRQGSHVAGAGEDSEICLILTFAGWRLWYDPRLRLCHFLPASRLRWGYLCQLHKGFGSATVHFDAYYNIEILPMDLREQHRQKWQYQVFGLIRQLLCSVGRIVLKPSLLKEGQQHMLDIYHKVGRLSEVLRQRKKYDLTIIDIRERFRPFKNARSKEHKQA
ncbi:MAG: glycosyltransferase [Candidatus Omnitrophota bacterium]|nr:MAG: glycosyltransferase [Candidatus Omnitrophota bacterium]